MNNDKRIISWLDALPASTKRKRCDPPIPPEIKSYPDAIADTPPPKRRAGMETHHHKPEPEEAIEIHPSLRRRMPRELLDLWRELVGVHLGRVPVLQATARPGVQVPYGRKFADSDPAGGVSESASAVPPIDDVPGAAVAELLAAARRCEARQQDENGWNQAVHSPLLRLALPAGGDIDFEPCARARITPDVLPLSVSSGEKVDYCLIVNKPVDDGQPALEVIGVAPVKETPHKTIRVLRRTQPGFSINHTNFGALRKWPIAVSIVTKKAGLSDEQAKMQVAVWQASQWQMLRWQQQEQEELASELRLVTDSSMPPLAFLPAIIVVGHRWKMAATTWEEGGGRTVLWTGLSMGTTDSMLGIYRIIWCVRRLAHYASERYWPWYAENILGLRHEARKDS